MANLPRRGDSFGRYVIEQPLGAGGMGVVHLALDTQMQRRVALKVMSDQSSDSAEFLARFHREAETLARLDSPHIVTIFDHGDIDQVPYLAMQYVAGGDLGTLLKQRGPLPVALAATVAAQVAEALHDAHTAGVVHRDVKPANVLVRDPDAAEQFVYLSDFGIARSHTDEDGLTQADGVAGSWAYLAPERAKGAPASPASDIYALGCLLHTCLTGRAPYAGSDVEMAVAHLNEAVPQLPGTDVSTLEVNRVLRRAMAKDPAERHPTAADLRVDLLGLAATSGTGTPAAASSPAPLPVSPVPAGSGSGSGSRSDPSHPSGPTAPVAGGRAPAASAPGGGRRGLVAAAVAVVLVVAAIGGVQLARMLGDDDPGDGSDDTRTPAAASGPGIAGDWDGDGLGDVRVSRSVWRDGSQPLPAQLFTSDGTAFAGPTEDAGNLLRPLAGDVDGDGRLDLVQVTEADDDSEVTVDVFRGTGDGVEELSSQTFGWRTDYGFYGTGDFDGDGRTDLVLTRNRGEQFMVVAVALGNGAGFEEPVEFASRGGRVNEDDLFAVGDFDGDGLDDLAARVVNGGQAVGVRFRVLLSTGTTFRKMATTRLEDARFGLADYTAADLDGDGADELVHLITDRFGEDEYGATLAVQRFANGAFGTPEELVEPLDGGPDIPFLEVGASDVDGDGDEDVVRLRSYDDASGSATLEVYLADGGSVQEPLAWGEVPCDGDCEGEGALITSSE